MFLLRFIKFTFIFSLLVPLMLIGAILLLFVCPFVPNDKLRLPALFKWWDIVDDYIGRDTSVIKKIYAQGWWARYCYIAWRNPINYFDYVYLGLHWTGKEIYTFYNPSDDNVGDTTNARPGFRYIEISQGDKIYWEYYLIWLYPFKQDTCLRFRMGWKIGNNKNPANTVSQWCFVISPFKTFSGVKP